MFLPAEVIPPVRSAMETRRTDRIHGIPIPLPAGISAVRIALLLGLLIGRRVDAALPGEVVAWGSSSEGQTRVPVGARSNVVAVAAGFSHTVALRSDGGVVAWGGNGSGQTDVPATAKTGIIAVAAGSDHTLALTTNGAVVAWGDSSSLQTEVPLPAQNGVVRIAAGAFHSLALSGDGSIIAWGDNSFGQRVVPSTVQTRVIAIAAGYGHTVALKDGGEVVAWGDNRRGQTNVPAGARTGVTAIAAGTGHNVALKDDGTVIAWGDDREGQSTVPAKARAGVVAVAAGGSHSMALRADGSVVVWGSNISGQRTAPSAASSGVAGIAAGWSHSVAVGGIPSPPVIRVQPSARSVAPGQMSGFTVIAEGFPVRYQWQRDGQDILGATGPVYHPGPAQAHLAGGYSVVVSNSSGSVTSAPPAMLSVAPVEPGAVVEWGDDLAGQTVVPAAAMAGVKAMAVGFGHRLALKNDGSVLAWGDDRLGQTDIPIGARTGVKAVAAGYGHSVALRTDGSVVAWGDKSYGQATVIRAARTDVVAIAAGTFHTVALKSDGSVIAWGAGAAATNEDPERGQSIVPVAALGGVMAIAAGDLHTLALRSDGSVLGWGWDEYGQCNVPDAAKSNVVAIAAGGFHSMALRTDGSVVAWGLDSLGRTTVPAGAMSGIVAIAAGRSHSVALKSDGSLVTWGSEINGERKAPASLPPAVAIAAGGYLTAALVAPGAIEDTPPTVGSVPDQTVQEDSGPLLLSFRVGDAETAPDALVVVATADDPALFPAAGIRLGGSGGQRTLALEPAAGRYGGTEVAIVVRDAAGLSVTNRFRVAVTSVNDAPTIDPIDDVLVPEDAPAQTILLSGITSGSAFEAQKLSVDAVSDNTAILPDPVVEYSSPGTTGRIILRPAPDANGTTTVTVTVKDYGGTASGGQDTFIRRFRVAVAPVDDPPTVVFAAPLDGSSFVEGTPIHLSAKASDIDDVVAKVEFFDGAVRIGEVLAPPFDLTWKGAAAGPHTITARAIDGVGASTVSMPVRITVLPAPDLPPVVALVAPVEGRSFLSGTTITLEAVASDAEGPVVSVEFFRDGGISMGKITQPPFRLIRSDLATGQHVLTAVATDGHGATTTSAPVRITVEPAPDLPPVVALVAPSDGQGFLSRTTITLEAVASDAEGPVVSVEFFRDAGISMGKITQPPFRLVRSDLAAGQHVLTAVATDGRGATTTSAPVRIEVFGESSDVAIVRASDDPEIGRIAAYLAEMEFPGSEGGLTSRVFAREEMDFTVLERHRLLVWDDPSPTGSVTAAEVDLLRRLRSAGIPIYLLGPGLAAAADALRKDLQERWRDLVHVRPADGSTAGGDLVPVGGGGPSPILDGSSGLVGALRIQTAVPNVVAVPDGEVTARLGLSDVLVAYPSPSAADTGQTRVFTQIVPLVAGGDAASVAARRTLFKNTVCWLIGCSRCAVVSLRVLEEASGFDPAVPRTGEILKWTPVLAETAECAATGVRVQIRLADGLGFIGASTPLGEVSEEGGVVTFRLGRLEVARPLAVELLLRPSSPGPKTNHFEFRANGLDVHGTIAFTDEVVFDVAGDARPALNIEPGAQDQVLLRFVGRSGTTYVLERSSDPAGVGAPTWTAVQEFLFTPPSSPISAPLSAEPGPVFYRVRER